MKLQHLLILGLSFLVFPLQSNAQSERKALNHTIQSVPHPENGWFINQHQSYIFLMNGNLNDESRALSPKTDGATLTLPEGKTEIQIVLPNGSQKKFPLYVDGSAPKTQLIWGNAPQFSLNDELFLGKNVQFSLSSTDLLSGVSQILYAVNNNPFQKYNTQPITLSNEGNYVLYFYAVDKVGNVESVHNKIFIIDRTGPTLSHRIEGINVGNIVPASASIKLKSTDNASGLAQIRYGIDETPTLNYSVPIILSALDDGFHVLTALATDKVNNTSDTLRFRFYLDRTAPVVNTQIEGPQALISGQTYLSASSKIRLDANDNHSGVAQIQYFINQQTERDYENPISMKTQNGMLTLTFLASDLVGNTSERFSKKVYIDNTSPETKVRFSGYYASTNKGFSINADTRIFLDASDLEAGIKNTFFRINNDEWTSYTDAIELNKLGESQLSFYSIDLVENSEEIQHLIVNVVAKQENSLSSLTPEKPQNKQPYIIWQKGKLIAQNRPLYLWLSASDSNTAQTYLLASPDSVIISPLLTQPNQNQLLKVSVDEIHSEFNFITDATAPQTKLSTQNAAKTMVNSVPIFAPGVSLHLHSVDAISGVANTFTSENGAGYQIYKNPLRGYYAEQTYSLRYFGVDSVGNTEETHSYTFRIDATAPITSHIFLDNFSGNTVSRLTTLQLKTDDNLSGVDSVFIQLNDEKPVLYLKPITLGTLGKYSEAYNTITYWAIDKVGNREQRRQFTFTIDENGPKTKLSWQGSIFKTEAITYAHPSASFSLHADDEEVEIRSIWYAINKSEKKLFTKAVSVADLEKVRISFGAEDVVGNQSPTSTLVMYVDKDAPLSRHHFEGNYLETDEGILLGANGQLILKAKDKISGVSHLKYSINDGKSSIYNKPLSFESSGTIIVRYFAIDHVGNQEEVHILSINYDQTPPEIDLSYSNKPIESTTNQIRIPKETLVSIKSIDRHSEVISVEYLLDAGEWKTYLMPLVFREKGNHTLHIRARDLMGNEMEKSLEIQVE